MNKTNDDQISDGGYKTKKDVKEFEFCEVCKLNHDQGRRHKYFPSHAKSLSSFVSRFQKKLADVRFFLRNPSTLCPEHAASNRLWCVFCNCDIVEVGSSFACGNAIRHLATASHLKNTKSFMWKHGGKMDQVDSLRILEAELIKWEKKCRLVKSEASSEGSHGLLIGPLNNIHNEMNSECLSSFDENSSQSHKSSLMNSVMPLQNGTAERCQVAPSEICAFTVFGPALHTANSKWHAHAQFETNPCNVNGLKGYTYAGECFADGSISTGGVCPDGKVASGGIISQGLQNLTQISTTVQQEAQGNVHSGAPPPWFDATVDNSLNAGLKPEIGSSSLASSLSRSGKSKLNPKRVGAAWADRRKMEMEMEKRGEVITKSVDANWLPNFGRVWQSGTRKESRKEFEAGKKNPFKVDSQPETSIKIQPYSSKRMRSNTSE